MTYRFIYILICLLFLSGCNDQNHNSELTQIAEIISDNPNDALSMLGSVNYQQLSENDQYYYDFLKIKAEYNCNIQQANDSIMRECLDYFSRHDAYKTYPEELYKRNELRIKEYKLFIFGLILAILILIFYVIYLKQSHHNKIISLQNKLGSIINFENNIKSTNTSEINDNRTHSTDDSPNQSHQDNISDSTNSDETLRNNLITDLLKQHNKYNCQSPISPRILRSDVYHKLQKMIENNKQIKENDKIWDEIEKTVLEISPDFIINLNILCSGNVSIQELKICLLIKCGMRPSQLSILSGRSNGAIISRREMLCKKVFGGKIGVKYIDGIIRLL